MKLWVFFICVSAFSADFANAFVVPEDNSVKIANESNQEPQDFNPFATDVEDQIQHMDQQYEQETGVSPLLAIPQDIEHLERCFRMECPIYINVNKAMQLMGVYLNGQLAYTFPVSTGKKGFTTPDFDTNPNGRVYQIYSSTKYPGYNNMPYAVFIKGGFAIHGTSSTGEAQLGRPASHGCIRLRTENAKIINEIISRSIKDAGGSTKDIWITIK